MTVRVWPALDSQSSGQCSGAGTIEIQLDGQSLDTVSLSSTGARQPQQAVFTTTGLVAGNHTLGIVNRGAGSVSVDAIAVR
jgi:hypothetical protein